jgi:hypothetical protein
MKRSFTFPTVFSVVASGLIAFSAVKLYVVWVAVLLFWFGGVAFQYRKGVPELPTGLRVWHRACVLGFPIATTFVKWHLFVNDLGSDVGIGNRVQHFSWALCTVGLFAPMLRRWMTDREVLQKILIAVGFVSMLGNLNEIAEWRRGGMQYGDTIKDLTMNILGSVLGGLIIVALDRREGAALHVPRHRASGRRTIDRR